MQSLDIEEQEKLIAYLRETGRIGPAEAPGVRVLSGGVSNRTVLVERPSGEAWVLKQALPKLRVQVDWFSSPERAHREAIGLSWLARLAPPGTTCKLVFEDPKCHLIAMEAVPQPHENWKAMLLSGRLQADHVAQFGRLLGAIHRNACELRGELAGIFDDRSYFESLRLEPYYSYTSIQVAEAASFLSALIDETRSTRLTLTHGDYSPKNVLVHRGKLMLLDHEVIHFGDPAFDLGFSLTHFLGKANHLPRLRRAFAEAAVDYWNVYREALGGTDWAKGLEERAVRHTLACTLARVAGRSPLEYLDASGRARQHRAALALMARPPLAVADLACQFIAKL